MRDFCSSSEVYLLARPQRKNGDAELPIERAERRASVAAALNSLADEERLVLEWKYLDELSVGQIAERLGRTPKAIESILFRARRSFRAVIGRDEQEDCYD